MRKIYLLSSLIAAAAAASSASAMPANSAANSPNGDKLQYVSTVDSAGILRISGSDTEARKRFSFRVSHDGYVSGMVDGKPVTYFVPREKRDQAVAAVSRRLSADASVSALTAGSR